MSSILSQLASFGPALVPMLGAIGGAISGSKFIQEGERGVKLRFGKVVRTRRGVPKVVRPGFVFVIPAIEHLHRTHVRVRTVDLTNQEIMLTDGMEFEVGGMVRFHVHDTAADVYAALFETNGLNKTVADYVSVKLRDVLADLTYQEVLSRTTVTAEVTKLVRDQLGEWGLELLEFNLTDCSPTPQSARAILIGAETRMRGEALLATAKMVAESQDVKALSATVAAALIGTPVATSLDGRPASAVASAAS